MKTASKQENRAPTPISIRTGMALGIIAAWHAQGKRIGFEERVEKMILPDAVDAEVGARKAFPLEPDSFQQFDGSFVVRQAGGLDPVQAQNGECETRHRPH